MTNTHCFKAKISLSVLKKETNTEKKMQKHFFFSQVKSCHLIIPASPVLNLNQHLGATVQSANVISRDIYNKQVAYSVTSLKAEEILIPKHKSLSHNNSVSCAVDMRSGSQITCFSMFFLLHFWGRGLVLFKVTSEDTFVDKAYISLRIYL